MILKSLVAAAVLVLVVAWFGFVGPMAVSSSSTEVVLGWVVVTLFAAALILGYFAQKGINKSNKGEKK